MAKISPRFIKKNDNQFQVGAGDELEIKLKAGGGISADADGLFASVSISGDLVFKGDIDASGSAAQLADAKSGNFWKVSVAGTLLGIELEIGDNLYCTADVTGTPASGASFSKIDNTENPDNIRNLAGATAKTLPRFKDATGKVVEASDVVIEDDNSLNLPSGAQLKIAGTKINTADVTGANDRCERHVITSADLAAKWFDCSFAAYDLAAVNVSACGIGQDRVDDYSATNSGASGVMRIGWSGLGMDGLLEVGDIIVVEYTT